MSVRRGTTRRGGMAAPRTAFPDVRLRAFTLVLALLALSIVASFQAIGTLLVFGLLVGPPAAASLLVHRVPAIMVTSMLLGAIAVVAGLLVSFHHGTAGGATIAGFSVLEFFIALTGREVHLALRRSRSPVAAT